MPSFDISIKADQNDIQNAIQQIQKEIANRFDFKGTCANVELNDIEIISVGESDFQVNQIKEIIFLKFGKRNIDTRLLDVKDKNIVSGDKIKQSIFILNGIEIENSKKIVKFIKNQKNKVQPSIQGTSIKVSGNKKDLLQEIISLLKKEFKDLPLIFENFRD
jgi:uncharacterized protein YajQ (UPF0234 family)